MADKKKKKKGMFDRNIIGGSSIGIQELEDELQIDRVDRQGNIIPRKKKKKK